MRRRTPGPMPASSGRQRTPDPRTGTERHPPARQVPAAVSWVSVAARAAVALLLAVLGGLVVAALAPLAAGLSAHVVVSGSMAPRVDVGDVVLTRSVSTAELSPGQVLLF